MRSLRVVYDGPPNPDLDGRIEDSIKPLGWKMWASGYSYREDERDLAFELVEGEKDGN